MKKILTLLMFVAFCTSSYAVHTTNWSKQFQNQPEIQGLSAEMTGMNVNQFLEMTPKKYKAMTGKKLGFGKTIKLKMAQKFLKKKMKKKGTVRGRNQIVATLLAFFIGGFGIHRLYLGYSNWWLQLLLTFLFGIGLIWAFIDFVRIVIGDMGPADGSDYDPGF